jgi:hypothetical protein
VWCVSDGHDDEAVGTSELGLAERVGIEPTVPLPGQQFSRLPDSATLAPLRLVELASRQGRVGADVSLLRSALGGAYRGECDFSIGFLFARRASTVGDSTGLMGSYLGLFTRVRDEIALKRLPREAYFVIRARLARKAGRVRCFIFASAPVAHVLLVSLTIHERRFTRKSSGSAVAVEAFVNDAG